jgi:hypothetical protein
MSKSDMPLLKDSPLNAFITLMKNAFVCKNYMVECVPEQGTGICHGRVTIHSQLRFSISSQNRFEAMPKVAAAALDGL